MKNMKWLNVILVIIAVVVSGCTGSRVNLVDKGVVSIERMPSKIRGVYFHDVHVNKKGDELVVSGNVKRRYTSVSGTRGHVDVAVVTPDGKVVKYVSTAYSPKAISKRSHPGSHFKVSLPGIPQDGSNVRVAIHEDIASDKSADARFDCGKNVAIPNA